MSRTKSEPPKDDELPPPSPELVIIGITQSAMMATLERLERREIKGRDFRREYLREVESRWQRAENNLGIVRIRHPSRDREVQEVFARARAWWIKVAGVSAIHDELGTK